METIGVSANSYTLTAGYTCPSCGAWVYGGHHICNPGYNFNPVQYYPQYIYVMPEGINELIEQVKELIKSVENIIEKSQ